MLVYYSYIIFQKLCYYLNYFLKTPNFSNSYQAHYYCSSGFVLFYIFFFSFCFLVFFLCQFVVARNKMPYLLLWLSRVAADSKTLWSLHCHSGTAFFINNNTIRSLFCLFCFFVYLVASINKFEL